MPTLPTLPDTPFYAAVLRGIGAPVTGNTLAALYAWRQMEGGKAAYNPFNTTWKRPGSTLYAANKHGVQNYADPLDGVEATVQTLRSPKYASIVAAFQNDKPTADIAETIIGSRWGTSSRLRDVVAMFARGRVVVAPITTIPGAPAISTLDPAPTTTPAPRSAPAETPTRWWLWAALGLATVAFVVVPGFLLPKSVPKLPAPKSNPRRRALSAIRRHRHR